MHSHYIIIMLQGHTPEGISVCMGQGAFLVIVNQPAHVDCKITCTFEITALPTRCYNYCYKYVIGILYIKRLMGSVYTWTHSLLATQWQRVRSPTTAKPNRKFHCRKLRCLRSLFPDWDVQKGDQKNVYVVICYMGSIMVLMFAEFLACSAQFGKL